MHGEQAELHRFPHLLSLFSGHSRVATKLSAWACWHLQSSCVGVAEEESDSAHAQKKRDKTLAKADPGETQLDSLQLAKSDHACSTGRLSLHRS